MTDKHHPERWDFSQPACRETGRAYRIWRFIFWAAIVILIYQAGRWERSGSVGVAEMDDGAGL
jgi:hypothetical protein